MKPPKEKIRGETFYHDFLRYLSFFIVTKLLWKTSITPNQITIFRNLIVIVSFYLFLRLDWCYILGFLLFQFAEVLDSVDGDLARYKNLKSKLGIWLEIFFDAILTPVWGVLGFLFVYIAYSIDRNFLYFFIWGAIGFSVNLEKTFYIHFKEKESFSEANHGHVYFGFKGEPLFTKLKNFIIVSKSWENQWLLITGLIYVLFNINLFLYVWIWLLMLNQIHWIRLAIHGCKKTKS